LRKDAKVIGLSQKDLEALFEVKVRNAAELIRKAKEKGASVSVTWRAV
jgi:hypothetical protein